MCDWRLFRDAPDKSHNTPTSWCIYVAGLNAKHMLKKGGIPYYQTLAEERSKLIYDVIDRSAGFYSNEVDPRFRSRVNLPFRILKNQPLEAIFLESAAQHGLMALGGYKGIGCRASMYNAMPIEGAEALTRFMRQFMDENHRKVCYSQGKL